MALLSLFFNSGLSKSNSIATLTLDATLEERHLLSTTSTDNPVENASDVQDHIINDPRRLEMVGFITDTPLSVFGVGQTSGFRTKEAYDEIVRIWKTRTPFTVVSGYDIYTSMVFENVSMPKVREGALRFSATMKEFNLVTGQTVAINDSQGTLSSDNVSNPAQNAAGQDAGRQPTKEPTPPQEEKSGSLLTQILGL